jgi:hypothetical protein
MTHKIRTTMRPWLEVEVSDKEYLDLQRQNLIHHEPQSTAPAAAPKKTPTAPAAGTTKEG